MTPALGMQPQTGAGPAPMAPPSRNIGGLLPVSTLSDMQAEQDLTAEAVARAQEAQTSALLQGLSGHIRHHWSLAKDAKQKVEQEMLRALRAKRGEYDPDVLAKIKKSGGSEIYMMLFATKARQAKALMVDVLIGAGTEKPWTIQPSPVPELPPHEVQQIMQAVQEQAMQAEMMGINVTVSDIRQALMDGKQQLENQVMETARIYAERAEKKIEDVLVEGGWLEALDQFLDDMMVFKTAFLKGPIVRKVPQLKWEQGQEGTFTPVATHAEKLEFERVDPFNIYPAPWAKCTDDAYLIERHKLSRSDLNALIGVEGYDEDAIRAVLDTHGQGGLHEWLQVDNDKAHAEGRDSMTGDVRRSETIDALQYWGCVSGKMLREWGMTPEEVPDEAKEYEIEAWQIGQWTIKVVINADPLYRRPYYSDGYSRTPGAFWHNSLYDALRDCQDMCNSAARALANNLGIASGPQVVVNVQRLPPTEPVTEMFPWKIWQVQSDEMGSSAAAIDFFQPDSNAKELMEVFQNFSNLADEYSGIPKYMAGIGSAEGGAGRTASGMSMMIGNASKQIKQLVSSIDMHCIAPSVERTYQWLMQYDQNSGLKGDLNIVARGALALVTKEQAQMRRNEFLMATANPMDMQIIGLEGRAEILREMAKGLQLNPDKVVPTISVLKQRAAMMMQQQALAGPGGQQQPGGGGEKPQSGGQQNGQELQNGAPVTDNFSPQPQKGPPQ